MKNIAPPPGTRCSICGKAIHNGQPYETSRLKGGGTAYAHKGCIKYRKERKT